MPAQTVCVTGNGSIHHQVWYTEDLENVSTAVDTPDFHRHTLDEHDIGTYVSLDIDGMIAAAFLEEGQTVEEGEILTLRVYTTVAAKKAVVVKDDDLLTRKEMLHHSREVATATSTEIRTWIDNTCFEKYLLKQAKNIMTSRYVAKWKWVCLLYTSPSPRDRG